MINSKPHCLANSRTKTNCSVMRKHEIATTVMVAVTLLAAGRSVTAQAQQSASRPGEVNQANSAPDVPGLKTDAASVTTLQAINATSATDDAITEGTRSYTTPATRAGTGLSLSLRETPQSVSVITRQRIEDQNMLSVRDVMAGSPGISVQNYDTERYSFNSRGFSIDNYLYDGIPTTVTGGGGWIAGESSIDPIIYDRIEVVRGATGLLTGAGNPSAAVNLVRKRANSKEFKADLSLGAGSFDTYRSTADLQTPITADGRVRGRIVGAYQKNHSYLDNYSNRKTVFYGTIEADLTERTTLRFGYNYQENDPKGSGWGGFPLWYADGSRTDWDRSLNIGTDWSKWATKTQGAFLNLEHNFDNGWRVDAMLNYSKHSADEKLLFLSSFPDATTGRGLSPSASRYVGDRTQKSADLKVSGPFELFGRTHELVVGASLSRQRALFYGGSGSNVMPIDNFLEWDGAYPEPIWNTDAVALDNRTNQAGVYLATRLNVTDDLKVILGGRYSQWKREQAGNTPLQFDKSAFTPYAGILYDLNDYLTAYASYTSIFNPQDSQDREGRWLDPVEGNSYEVGLKGAFLDGRLNASVAVFQIDQDNLKQQDVGYLVPGTINQAYYAAKGTRSRGYDLEVSGEPLEGWNLMAGLSHWTAGDANGNAVQTNQPRTLFKLFSTYRLAGALHGLTVGGGMTWQSGDYTLANGPNGKERVSQGSYALIDLMARYQVSERVSVQVNLNNLLNKKYYSQIGFYNQGAWGAPRNVMATLSYKY